MGRRTAAKLEALATVALFVLLIPVRARPLTRPLAAANAAVVRLIARSSLVQPGLEKFQAWDERLRKAWR